MPQTHPAEWGWKVVKLRFVRNLSPSAIVAHFEPKHRSIGMTYVKARIRNYRQTGNPNAKAESINRQSERVATRSERKWLKRELLRNPVQFFDQLQVAFTRKFGCGRTAPRRVPIWRSPWTWGCGESPAKT